MTDRFLNYAYQITTRNQNRSLLLAAGEPVREAAALLFAARAGLAGRDDSALSASPRTLPPRRERRRPAESDMIARGGHAMSSADLVL